MKIKRLEAISHTMTYLRHSLYERAVCVMLFIANRRLVLSLFDEKCLLFINCSIVY